VIYPPNTHISSKIARAMVLELYALDNIESSDVLKFAEKYKFIVTTKREIREIARLKGLKINTMIARDRNNRMKSIVTAVCMLITLGLSAQVKPVNDTMRFVQGIGNSANVLTNDIGPNLRVTSWKVRTTTYDTGKVVSLPGVGTVTINGRGLLIYKNANDTFAGTLPEISYIANNTLSRGVSAKVFVTIFKRPVPPSPVKPAYVIYKEDNQIVVDYGSIRHIGVLYAYPVCGSVLYCVVAQDAIYRLSKEEYDILNK
jgi:hypothetical protein